MSDMNIGQVLAILSKVMELLSVPDPGERAENLQAIQTFLAFVEEKKCRKPRLKVIKPQSKIH